MNYKRKPVKRQERKTTLFRLLGVFIMESDDIPDRHFRFTILSACITVLLIAVVVRLPAIIEAIAAFYKH